MGEGWLAGFREGLWGMEEIGRVCGEGVVMGRMLFKEICGEWR